MDRVGCYLSKVSRAENEREWGSKRGPCCEGSVGRPLGVMGYVAKEVKAVFATGG